jgi:hypothetical protein
LSDMDGPDDDSQEGTAIPDLELYTTLLGMPYEGEMFSALSRAQAARGRRYFVMLTHGQWITAALNEIVAHFNVLNGMEAREEILKLIRRAKWDVIECVEAMLRDDEGNSSNLCRDLMEIEFLFRDFAREPTQIDAWLSLGEHHRNQQFGFGKLLGREAQAQAVPHGKALPDKLEYAAHSIALHPTPKAEDHSDHSSIDDLTSLSGTAGDLIQHVARVFEALELLLDSLDAGPKELRSSWRDLSAVAAAHEVIRDWMTESRNALPEDTFTSREPFEIKDTPFGL